MAKKKGGNKGNSNNSSVDAGPRASYDAAVQAQVQAEQVVLVKQENHQQQQQQQHADTQERSIENLSIEELRGELQAARAEIASLKSRLGVKQSGKLSQPQDVQELQSKLATLRKEQQEADAARDKAWTQLKAVVQEISSLANPDYLQSLVVKPQE